MVDVAKREDRLLDTISDLLAEKKRWKQTQESICNWLAIYQEANLINPELAIHLEEVLYEMDGR